ncbi:MAG: hypothetical protein IJQ67_06430 [Bacilli bacterium]|nr:hypothetical protein [Bacilli bacterium]
MKKISKLVLLISTFFLVGCSTGTSKKKDSLFGHANTVISSPFVTANVNDPDNLVTNVHVPGVRQPSITLGEGNTIYDQSYASKGLLVIKNAAENLGFYSIANGDYLIKPRYKVGWTDWQVYNMSYLSFLISIKYEDQYALYDSFGNLLMNERLYSANEQVVDGKVYLTIDDYSYSGPYIFEYDGNGNMKSVESIPQPTVIDYTGPAQGSTYQEGRYNLDEYGFVGYTLYIAGTGLITTYVNGVEQASFYIDLNSFIFRGFIGSKMVFQRYIKVPNEYEHYDYVENNMKYSLETVVIDFINGKKEEKNVSVVIDDIIPLRKQSDLAGIYSYVLYRLVNDNYILTDTLSAIVNQDFNICDDVSGHEVDAFIKLSNGYFYNTVTGYLYDDNLRIVTSLYQSNPTYYPALKAFVGSWGGKRGIISETGVVLHEFIYDNIYANHCPGNGKVIATKDSSIYRLTVSSSSSSYYNYEEYIGDGLNVCGTNLFTDSYGDVFSSDEMLINGGYLYTTTVSSYYLLQNRTYVVIQEDQLYQSIRMYGIIYDDFTPAFVTTSQGTEITEVNGNGGTMDTATTLKRGYNVLHTVDYGNVSYGLFSAPTSGYYTFYLNSGVTITNNYICGEPVNSSSAYDYINNIYYETKYTAYFEADFDVVINFNYSNYYNEIRQAYDLYIAQEVGTNSSYPLEIKGSGIYYLEPAAVKSYYYYIRFTAQTLGNYRLYLEDSEQNTIDGIAVDDVDYTYDDITLGEDCTCLFFVTLNETVDTEIRFRIEYSNVSLEEYSTDQNPYMLNYGDQESYINLNVNPDSPKYVAFASKYGGRYSLSFDYRDGYEPSNSPIIYVYDRNGIISDYAISQNNIDVEAGGRIIAMFSNSYNEDEIWIDSYRVYTATTGYSYENPLTSFNSQMNNYNNVPMFYKYINYSTCFDTLYYTETNDAPLHYIHDDQIHLVNKKGTFINLYDEVENWVVFRLGQGSVTGQVMTQVLNKSNRIYYTGSNNVYVYAANYKLLEYRNTSDETIELYVSFSIAYGNYIYYGFTYQNYLLVNDLSTTYSSGYSYTMLEPGESVFVGFYNSSDTDMEIELYLSLY